LGSFYNSVLEKHITGVNPETNSGSDIFYGMFLVKIAQKYFRTRLNIEI